MRDECVDKEEGSRCGSGEAEAAVTRLERLGPAARRGGEGGHTRGGAGAEVGRGGVIMGSSEHARVAPDQKGPWVRDRARVP